MKNVIKTKIYSFSVRDVVKMFISEHSDGDFVGSVLYCDRTKSPDSPGFDYHFDLKMFTDTEEERVYKRCIQWVRENFGEDCKAELIETRQEH